MSSEIIKLLRDTANNFAQLAEVLEQEQKNTSKRIDCLEMTVHETKDTMRAAADLILRQL